jgi:hypothetical protein
MERSPIERTWNDFVLPKPQENGTKLRAWFETCNYFCIQRLVRLNHVICAELLPNGGYFNLGCLPEGRLNSHASHSRGTHLVNPGSGGQVSAARIESAKRQPALNEAGRAESSHRASIVITAFESFRGSVEIISTTAKLIFSMGLPNLWGARAGSISGCGK